MAETKYEPIRHDHNAFLKKAKTRSGFQEAYEALAFEYQVAIEMLAARAGAGLTQEGSFLERASPKQRTATREKRSTE